MSINLKSLMGKYNSSSPREKILLLALVGSIAVGGAYYLTTVLDDSSNTAGKPAPSTTVAKAQSAKTANLPQLAMAQEQGMRNPFLPPAEFQQFDSKVLSQGAKAGQPGSGNVSNQPPGSKNVNNTRNYSNLDQLLHGTGKKNNGNGDSIIQSTRPALVGIVEGAEKRLAIISYGGDSRSYGIYERVGSYQITSISSSSVILSGPAGRMVLAVRR